MSEAASDDEPRIGTIAWRDLTVDDAEGLRDFYTGVIGWAARPEKMDGYSDFSMIAPSNGETVAGICHARGPNVDLPPQWLVYIVVEDVERSSQRCVELGGEIVADPRALGGGRVCVIRDPAGAVCALYESGD